MMKTNNPFRETYDNGTDLELVKAARDGSGSSLEMLIRRHQHYVYNVVHKMVLSPFDAEDVTQEILIIVATRIHQFQGESAFRTWLYRIAVNHVLQMKRKWLEEYIRGFDSYGLQLAEIADGDMTIQEQLEYRELITEAKFSCMAGMLLCLDREQRMAYILGEIFKVDHNTGATLMDISRDNFRQKVSRARKDLHSFMSRQCGLVNTANPCRCHKKTKGFIEAGWIDRDMMKFNTSYRQQIAGMLEEKVQQLDELVEQRPEVLFRQHPFQEKNHINKVMQSLFPH